MEDSVKRGSDSLLESKLKERITKPRSLQNRYVVKCMHCFAVTDSQAQGSKFRFDVADLGGSPGVVDSHDQRDDPLCVAHRLLDDPVQPDERDYPFVPVCQWPSDGEQPSKGVAKADDASDWNRRADARHGVGALRFLALSLTP